MESDLLNYVIGQLWNNRRKLVRKRALKSRRTLFDWRTDEFRPFTMIDPDDPEGIVHWTVDSLSFGGWTPACGARPEQDCKDHWDASGQDTTQLDYRGEPRYAHKHGEKAVTCPRCLKLIEYVKARTKPGDVRRGILRQVYDIQAKDQAEAAAREAEADASLNVYLGSTGP